MTSPKNILKKPRGKCHVKFFLAKWVHQHKMHNVDMSDDERKVDQEYQNLRENKTEFLLSVKRIYKKSRKKITCP